MTHSSVKRATWRGDIIGNGGAVEVSDTDRGGQGYRTGAHTAVAANAHIDLKTHLLFGKGAANLYDASYLPEMIAFRLVFAYYLPWNIYRKLTNRIFYYVVVKSIALQRAQKRALGIFGRPHCAQIFICTCPLFACNLTVPPATGAAGFGSLRAVTSTGTVLLEVALPVQVVS